MHLLRVLIAADPLSQGYLPYTAHPCGHAGNRDAIGESGVILGTCNRFKASVVKRITWETRKAEKDLEDSNIDLSPKRIGALITTVVSGICNVHEQCEVEINEGCYRLFRRTTPISKITGAD